MNHIERYWARPWLRLLLSRFASPLVIILVAAARVSLIVHEWVDACPDRLPLSARLRYQG